MAFVYSCCFWFSLRLGAIIIGIFSAIQALILLVFTFVYWDKKEQITDHLTELSIKASFAFLDNILGVIDDPEKYFSLSLVITCFYMLSCLSFVYGAYYLKVSMMVFYIFVELVRLITLSVFTILWLLIIKQNSMDIGLLIGASVGSGFIFLGMFYLWVCAANLPLLIREMERDEQEATIARLTQMVEEKYNPRHGYDGVLAGTQRKPFYFR